MAGHYRLTTPESRVARIDLPSGGWWEIQTRPLWKHVCDWALEAQEDRGAPGLVERALVSLTTAWSFADEVCLETLAQRHADDLIAVLEVFHREVAPLLRGDSIREMAEELFAEMIAGRIPGQFSEAHLMAVTGWSWHTLQETPADVVEKMSIYLAVTQARDDKRDLDFWSID